jgi:hypothetical protein
LDCANLNVSRPTASHSGYFSVHLVATIATLLVAASRFDSAGEFVHVAFWAMIPSPPHATKGDHAMTDRIKVALAPEMAAIIDSDVRSRLGDNPVTVDSLKEALIASVTTLMPAVDTSQIIAERDPEKPREIRVLVSEA